MISGVGRERGVMDGRLHTTKKLWAGKQLALLMFWWRQNEDISKTLLVESQDAHLSSISLDTKKTQRLVLPVDFGSFFLPLISTQFIYMPRHQQDNACRLGSFSKDPHMNQIFNCQTHGFTFVSTQWQTQPNSIGTKWNDPGHSLSYPNCDRMIWQWSMKILSR